MTKRGWTFGMAALALLAATETADAVGIAISIDCFLTKEGECIFLITPDPVHASPGDGINWHVSSTCAQPPCPAQHPNGWTVNVPGLGYNSGTLFPCTPSPILIVPNMPGVYPYTVTGSLVNGTIFVCLDLDGDQLVGISDLLILLTHFGPCADPNACPGDFDGNGSVGVTDLLALFQNWGPCPGFTGCPWDVNGDGVVDGADIQQVLDNLGPCDDPDACPEDVNGDGTVNVHDFLAVLQNLGPCP